MEIRSGLSSHFQLWNLKVFVSHVAAYILNTYRISCCKVGGFLERLVHILKSLVDISESMIFVNMLLFQE